MGQNLSVAEEDMQVDVIVLGSGPAALTVSAGLRDAGVAVARVPTGSYDTEGSVLVGTSEHPHRLLAALGPERTRAYVDWSKRSVERLGPLQGGLRVGMRDEAQELAQSAHSARALGLADTLVSVDQVTELVGVPLGPGRRCALDGWVDAAARMADLADPETPVVPGQISHVSGTQVTTSQEQVRGEMLIWAGGWEQARWLPWFADKLQPVRHQWLISDRPADGRLQCSGQHGYLRWHPVDSGLLVAGARWATPHLEAGETDPSPNPDVHAKLAVFLDALQPGAASTSQHAEIRTHTCDNLPIVGPLDARRIALTGFGQNEWALALAAADDVIAGVLGEPSALPDLVHPSRFVG
jgi:hypothetical protein